MPENTESVTTADAIWFHMDHPTNIMMVAAVLFFDEPLNIDKLKETLSVRLLKFKRFKQRVTSKGANLTNLTWEPDPYFDINSHIHRIALPDPGDKAALIDIVNDLVSSPLDSTKPLWQIHVVEKYNGDGCAVIVRIHHGIADGIALVYVLLNILDSEADAPIATPELENKREYTWNPIKTLIKQTTGAVSTTKKLAGKVVNKGIDMVTQPAKALDLAKLAEDYATNLGRMLTMGPDSQTVIKGELGVAKRVAWSESIPLSDVKMVGKVFGGTVNDILVAAYTGAMRRYLEGRGEPVDDIEIRMSVPLTLRPLEKAVNLGNSFGCVTLTLPINYADPHDRLKKLKERMDLLKRSPEALISFSSMTVVGMAPGDVASKVIENFNKCCTATMSNVPGPREPMYLAGVKMTDVMVWGPPGGRLGSGNTIVSYNNQVTMGVFGDAELLPDPEVLADDFVNEFNYLKELAEEK